MALNWKAAAKKLRSLLDTVNEDADDWHAGFIQLMRERASWRKRAARWKQLAKRKQEEASAWKAATLTALRESNRRARQVGELERKYNQHVHGWTVDTTARCCMCGEPMELEKAYNSNVCHSCWAENAGEADALRNMGCHE